MLEFLRNMFTMQRDRNERGASAVEYGLLLAGIAVVVLAGVLLLGPVVQKQFTDTCDQIDGAAGTADCTVGP